MKLKDLKNLFSNYTNVRLVAYDNVVVFEGFWHNVPADFENYIVDLIMPIKHPGNDNIGMAVILIKHDN